MMNGKRPARPDVKWRQVTLMPGLKDLIEKDSEPEGTVPVWDLPTRLFHWLIVVLVTLCVLTGKIGVNAMEAHTVCGYGMLTLLLFRLVWGVGGGYHARFAAFVRGPASVIRYVSGMMTKAAPRYLGHNPLGGWSVLAMLTALLLQAGTGLFANDDIFTEGPLYALITKATSDLLTRVHKFNAGVVGFLVAVHVLAILFYLIVKRDNLVTPMVTGRKYWRGNAPVAGGSLWAAAAVVALCAAAVYFIVR